jgi:transposase-like protein
MKGMSTVEAITCPYCGQENHTSNPSVMGECAYCQWQFAVAKGDNQTLVILDRNKPDAWETAEELMAFWQEHGELEKEAIVDRRLSREDRESIGRRLEDRRVILQ